jgi:anti-anti-sigma regulatory factor
MNSCSFTEKKPGQLALEGELTIYDAAELKDILLSRLHANTALSVDLSGVTELDTAGVQLMLMLQQESLSRGKKLQWKKHSTAVSQLLGLLNLGSTFGAPASVVWS